MPCLSLSNGDVGQPSSESNIEEEVINVLDDLTDFLAFGSHAPSDIISVEISTGGLCKCSNYLLKFENTSKET